MAADTEIASLFAKLGVKVDKRTFGEGKKGLDDLTKAAYGTEHAAEQARKRVQALAAAASDFATKGAKVLAAGLLGAAAGALALVKQTAAAGAALSDISARTGTSTTSLQRLGFAFTKAGAGPDVLRQSIGKLQLALASAAKGTGPQAEAFAKLGINLQAFAKLDTEAQFEAIAEGLAKIPEQSDRARAAVDLFGESGTQLLPAFEGGAKGLRGLTDEAQRLGLVLDESAIASADKLDETLEILEKQIGGVFAQIGSALIPVVQEIAEDVGAWVSQNRELIATKVEQFLREVIPLVRDFAKLALDLVGVVVKLADVLGGGTEALVALGAAYAGLKITTWAGMLTSANTAWASLIGTWAGGITVAASLGFAIGTALDKALGLSDAIAGVNQRKGGGANALLGDLTEDEKRRLGELVQKRDALNDQAENAPAFLAEAAARDAERAQREIDSIQGKGRHRANLRAKAAKASQGTDAIARQAATDEANRRAGEAAQQVQLQQGRQAFAQLGAFGERAIAGVRDVAGSVGNIPAPVRTKRTGGGRGKAAKPEESVADLLERDFGGGKGGSLRDAAGGGASAIAGASFVRIDASYNAPTTVNVVLPRGSLGRSDSERGAAIGDAAGKALEKRNRDAAEHYHEAVRP